MRAASTRFYEVPEIIRLAAPLYVEVGHPERAVQ